MKTLSVGLERTLTSKGFSPEGTGTLLSSRCPRRQGRERQNPALPLSKLLLGLRTSLCVNVAPFSDGVFFFFYGEA